MCGLLSVLSDRLFGGSCGRDARTTLGRGVVVQATQAGSLRPQGRWTGQRFRTKLVVHGVAVANESQSRSGVRCEKRRWTVWHELNHYSIKSAVCQPLWLNLARIGGRSDRRSERFRLGILRHASPGSARVITEVCWWGEGKCGGCCGPVGDDPGGCWPGSVGDLFQRRLQPASHQLFVEACGVVRGHSGLRKPMDETHNSSEILSRS